MYLIWKEKNYILVFNNFSLMKCSPSFNYECRTKKVVMAISVTLPPMEIKGTFISQFSYCSFLKILCMLNTKLKL